MTYSNHSRTRGGPAERPLRPQWYTAQHGQNRNRGYEWKLNRMRTLETEAAKPRGDSDDAVGGFS